MGSVGFHDPVSGEIFVVGHTRDGRVTVEVGNTPLSPARARELARKIERAAERAEQPIVEGR